MLKNGNAPHRENNIKQTLLQINPNLRENYNYQTKKLNHGGA